VSLPEDADRADSGAADPAALGRSRWGALTDRLAERRSFRLRVALIMAAVSLISAYATHVATEKNAEADNLNALASQQLAEEEQAEQQIDAFITQEQRLTAHYDETWHTYLEKWSAADAVRATDPVAAARLDLDAQASANQYIQLEPYFRAGLPFVSETGAEYDAETVRQVARSLDWRLYRASSELTRDDARQMGSTATSTVLVVVLLVGVLFLLTLAHVTGGRRGLLIAALAAAITLAAIAWFAVIDVAAALPLLIAAVIVGIGLIVARTPRVHAWLEGLEHDDVLADVSEVPIRPRTTATANPNDAPATRFNRYVAILIAFATLFGAVVGYLHAQASRSSAEQSWLALDLGVDSIGALRGAEERLGVNVEVQLQALARRVEAWDATQRAWFASWSDGPEEADRMSLEAERLEELAQRHEARSGLADELGRTGVSTETVLREVRAEVWEDPARLAALQDAAKAASQTWGVRAGLYLSVLAWLAVAAYLLGLSLIFRDRRVRIVLVAVGTLLIAAGVARTGSAMLEPEPVPRERAEQAAAAYAEGLVAAVRLDPAEAQQRFADAIELRPEFGIAHRDRAQAIMDTGSMPGAGFRGAFTAEAVNEAIEELEAARANRADSAGVFLNLGAMLFHRSIQSGSQADMAESVANTRSGLKLGNAYAAEYGSRHVNQLIGELNLALGLLGLGDDEAAAEAYRTAGEHIAELPFGLRTYLVSAGLAPLGVLGRAEDAPSAESIAAMKELLVAEAYEIEGGSSAAEVSTARAELFGSLLQWRATIPGFEPAVDRLVVQWYRLDPALESWSALPLASGLLTHGATVEPTGAFYSDAAAADSYWGNSGALLSDTPPACVRPGSYRVELYLNGRLAESAEAETGPDQAQYEPLLARDVGVAMCRPGNWSVTGTAGMSTTVRSADRSRGLAVFRVHQPRALGGADTRPAALDRVAQEGFESLPDGLTFGIPLDSTAEATVLGRNDGVWRRYDYPGGSAKMSATLLGSGTVLVVCQYGPEAWLRSAEATALIASIIPY
jgi:hypothetical protein